MSVHITSRAWKIPGLTPAEKLVLIRLADSANDEGVCWPALATIARDCDIDRRSVRRIIARLEARGLVHRAARYNAKGLQTSSWLTVLPPDDRRPATSETGGDRSVLPKAPQGGPVGPTGGDRSVLPGGDRSVLQTVKEPSKNLARAQRAQGAGFHKPSAEPVTEPPRQTAAQRAAVAASLGLPYRDPATGLWLRNPSQDAEKGGGVCVNAATS
jgi:hypothetical protein